MYGVLFNRRRGDICLEALLPSDAKNVIEVIHCDFVEIEGALIETVLQVVLRVSPGPDLLFALDIVKHLDAEQVLLGHQVVVLSLHVDVLVQIRLGSLVQLSRHVIHIVLKIHGVEFQEGPGDSCLANIVGVLDYHLQIVLQDLSDFVVCLLEMVDLVENGADAQMHVVQLRRDVLTFHLLYPQLLEQTVLLRLDRSGGFVVLLGDQFGQFLIALVLLGPDLSNLYWIRYLYLLGLTGLFLLEYVIALLKDYELFLFGLDLHLQLGHQGLEQCLDGCVLLLVKDGLLVVVVDLLFFQGVLVVAEPSAGLSLHPLFQLFQPAYVDRLVAFCQEALTLLLNHPGGVLLFRGRVLTLDTLQVCTGLGQHRFWLLDLALPVL